MIRYDLRRASHRLIACVSSLRNSDKLESAPFTDASQLQFINLFYSFFYFLTPANHFKLLTYSFPSPSKLSRKSKGLGGWIFKAALPGLPLRPPSVKYCRIAISPPSVQGESVQNWDLPWIARIFIFDSGNKQIKPAILQYHPQYLHPCHWRIQTWGFNWPLTGSGPSSLLSS